MRTEPDPPRLAEALAALEALAPLALAAPWDNTGLLLRGRRPVRRMGLTIDLTEAVLDELIAADVDLVVAYHPPIFTGLKRIVGESAAERLILRAAPLGLHLYSPHTALDAAAGGMGDWLLRAAGPVHEGRPIEPDARQPTLGLGRRGLLTEPAPAAALLPRIAAHLGLPALRVAGDLQATRRQLWACPGAGGALFRGAGPGDLVLTGELSHHDVLRLLSEGAAVVLTEHSNCERGYLPTFAARLRAALPGVEVHVSGADHDPLSPWRAPLG